MRSGVGAACPRTRFLLWFECLFEDLFDVVADFFPGSTEEDEWELLCALVLRALVFWVFDGLAEGSARLPTAKAARIQRDFRLWSNFLILE